MPRRAVYRFAVFEFDAEAGELRKSGIRLKAGGQPLQVLRTLLDHPGEVVSRDSLRELLWPDGVHVDFEHNLNKTVNRLRETLGDSADVPRYIETVPKKGYRLLVPVEKDVVPAPVAAPRRIRISWIAAGCLAVAGIIVALWMTRSRSAERPASYAATPITALPGREMSASFSPDGGAVAFAWEGESLDNVDIYRIEVGTAKVLRLTTSAKRDFSPAWSPDGKMIAYLSDIDHRTVALNLIEPGGGKPRQIGTVMSPPQGYTGFPIPRRMLAWSGDSRWVVLPDADQPGGPYELVAISIQDQSRRLVAPKPASGRGRAAPAISADGTRIAFLEGGVAHSGSGLRVARLDEHLAIAGTPRAIPLSRPWVDGVAWGPADSLLAAVAATLDGQRILELLPAGDSDKWSVLGGLGGDLVEAAWSRRGDRLAFTRLDSRQSSIWRYEPSAGGAPRQVTASTTSNMDADISPDGKQLAFRSLRSGRPAIWLSDSSGGDLRQLVDLGAEGYGNPRWSPDGQWVAFHARIKGDSHIFAARADGRETRQITSDQADDIFPTWSRDGRWIYFSTNRSGESWIWKAPLAGGRAERVEAVPGYYAMESGDGKGLFVATGTMRPKVVFVDFQTGAKRDVISSIASPAAFLPVGDQIYYLTPPDDRGRSVLRRIDTAGASPVSLLEIARPVETGLSLTADGRTAVFSQVDREESTLMLVEGFR